MWICHISGHAIFCCLSVLCTFRYCSALIFFLQLFTVLGQRAWRETGYSGPIHLLAGKTTCTKHSMGNYLYTVAFQTQKKTAFAVFFSLSISVSIPAAPGNKGAEKEIFVPRFLFHSHIQCRNSAIIPLPMTYYPDVTDLNDSSIRQACFQHFRHDISFGCKPDETGDRFLFTS